MKETIQGQEQGDLMPLLLGDGQEELIDKSEKYLSFNTSEEVYGVPISRIKEIIEYEVVTRVPMVPPYIKGVMNLRGSVVPVVDLSARLERPVGTVTKRTCIVIVEVAYEGESMDIGLSVDGVNEVLNIRDDDIEETPSFGVSIRPDFINGIGKTHKNFIVLLDVDTVLSVEELAMLGEVAESDSA